MLFALPYLPVDNIIRSFDQIASVTNDQLRPLVDYIRSTWIQGQWSPEDWCVYKRCIRANNDVEGWHNRLNMKAQRGNIQLYLLIHLLHSEAKLVPLQKQLITEDKLRRQQRKGTIKIQGAVTASGNSIKGRNQDQHAADEAVWDLCSKDTVTKRLLE